MDQTPMQRLLVDAQKYQMMDVAVQPTTLHPFAVVENERSGRPPEIMSRIKKIKETDKGQIAGIGNRDVVECCDKTRLRGSPGQHINSTTYSLYSC